MLVASTQDGRAGHDMGDGTDRRQPVHHRVSTAKGVSVVHPLEGKDTVGCRASLSNPVQHPGDR